MKKIEKISSCSDLILAEKFIGDNKMKKFWEGEYGKRFIGLFISSLVQSIKDKEYLSKNIDDIERISILIQRLFIGYKVKVRE